MVDLRKAVGGNKCHLKRPWLSSEYGIIILTVDLCSELGGGYHYVAEYHANGCRKDEHKHINSVMGSCHNTV